MFREELLREVAHAAQTQFVRQFALASRARSCVWLIAADPIHGGVVAFDFDRPVTDFLTVHEDGVRDDALFIRGGGTQRGDGSLWRRGFVTFRSRFVTILRRFCGVCGLILRSLDFGRRRLHPLVVQRNERALLRKTLFWRDGVRGLFLTRSHYVSVAFGVYVFRDLLALQLIGEFFSSEVGNLLGSTATNLMIRLLLLNGVPVFLVRQRFRGSGFRKEIARPFDGPVSRLQGQGAVNERRRAETDRLVVFSINQSRESFRNFGDNFFGLLVGEISGHRG